MNRFGDGEEPELVDIEVADLPADYWDHQVSYMADGVYVADLQLAEDLF
tara:strand:+ start:499 stop:645 length:147 start_codon:yes stop_codon:yes gene_type:complete